MRRQGQTKTKEVDQSLFHDLAFGILSTFLFPCISFPPLNPCHAACAINSIPLFLAEMPVARAILPPSSLAGEVKGWKEGSGGREGRKGRAGKQASKQWLTHSVILSLGEYVYVCGWTDGWMEGVAYRTFDRGFTHGSMDWHTTTTSKR